MENNLTDKQNKFLEALFNEAEGDFNKACKIAGYSLKSKEWLTEALSKRIIELASNFMATHAVKATMSMVNIMDNPTEEGNDRKLAAAKEILDRSGLTKIERIQVNSDKPIGVFILPPKDTEKVPEGVTEGQ